jgi:hypothetical protein
MRTFDPVPDVLASVALPLFLRLADEGFTLEAVDEHLRVSPAGHLTAAHRVTIQQHRDALFTLARICDAGVGERQGAFRDQLAAARPGTVPRFLFRGEVPYVRGRCFSCGDDLVELRFGRCWRCALAWRLAARLLIPTVVAEALDEARVVA